MTLARSVETISTVQYQTRKGGLGARGRCRCRIALMGTVAEEPCKSQCQYDTAGSAKKRRTARGSCSSQRLAYNLCKDLGGGSCLGALGSSGLGLSAYRIHSEIKDTYPTSSGLHPLPVLGIHKRIWLRPIWSMAGILWVRNEVSAKLSSRRRTWGVDRGHFGRIRRNRR